MTSIERARLAREAEALGAFRAAALLRSESESLPEPPDHVLALESEARELEALGRYAEALSLRARLASGLG